MIKGAYSFGSIKVDLSKELDLSSKIEFKDIFNKTGIQTIYKADDDESSLTLAVDAANKLLKKINEQN